MTFAFDYDGTINACPDVWVPAMQSALIQGHTIVIATGRTPENIRDIELFCFTHKLGVPIHACGSRPKREVLVEAGILVDAWVDDNPVMVDFGYDGLDMVGEYSGATKR